MSERESQTSEAAPEAASAASESEATAAPSAEEPTGADTEAMKTDPEFAELRQRIVEVLKTCYDPEIPVDIWELGLVYDIEIGPDRFVKIRMTLTSPMCPAVGFLPLEVETKVSGVPGVAGAEVELVWDPPWTPDRMSEEARLQLGF